MKKNIIVFFVVIACFITFFPVISTAEAGGVMIYEVYTSGGYTSGKSNVAPYANCYVVLYNGSPSAVELGGWTLRFAEGLSANYDPSKTVALVGSIQPFGYYVIKGGASADLEQAVSGADLPFEVNVNAPNLKLVRKSGKISLCNVSGTNAETVSSKDSFVVDFLGYGKAGEEVNDYETSPADGITVKRVFRRVARIDNNNNSVDFDTIDIVDNPNKVQVFRSGLTDSPASHISFSKPSGYYKTAFDIGLSSDLPGANVAIYYTLDGSDPIDENGKISAGAKLFDPGKGVRVADRTGEPSNLMFREGTVPDTMTDTRFMWPPYRPEDESAEDYNKRMDTFFKSIFKITAIKAVAKNEYGHMSEVSFASYIVSDEDIATKYNLPVFSIATDQKNLYDPETGIWMTQNHYKRGKEWERPANMQFFEKNGSLAFEDTIRIRLNGGYTRTYPQKAIRVYLDHTLNYDLFDGRVKTLEGKNVTTFKNFILRTFGNDWYSSSVRDAFMHEYNESLGSFETVGYRPCVTFINGEFFGIYEIRERQDDNMFANRFNIDKDDVAISEQFIQLKTGPEGSGDKLKKLIKSGWDKDMTLPENYEPYAAEFNRLVDINSYIDYMIAVIHSGYTDWPHNNLRLWRSASDEPNQYSKWRMLMNDMDYAYASSSNPTHDTLLWAMTHNANKSGQVLDTLLRNKEFRNQFVARCDELLRTFYIKEKMDQVLFNLQKEFSVAISDQRSRWMLTESSWHSAYKYISEYFAKRNVVMYQSMERNIGAVFFEANSAEGTLYVNGKELSKAEQKFGFKNEPFRVNAVAKPGYTFAGYEFQPVDGGSVKYYFRNNASFLTESGGVMKPVFVKNGETVPAQFQNTISAELKSRLSGSLVLILGVSEGYVKNQLIPIDGVDIRVRPLLIQSRTLVPARFIVESLGGTVSWDNATSTGTCKIGGQTVQFTLDSDVMTVNGRAIKLDVAAQTVGGRTMLPLRAFCESIGMTVFWDARNELIVISPGQQVFSGPELDEIANQLK